MSGSRSNARAISIIWRWASESAGREVVRIDALDPEPCEHLRRRAGPSSRRRTSPAGPAGSFRRNRFSATVIQGISVSSWKTVPTPISPRVVRAAEVHVVAL